LQPYSVHELTRFATRFSFGASKLTSRTFPDSTADIAIDVAHSGPLNGTLFTAVPPEWAVVTEAGPIRSRSYDVATTRMLGTLSIGEKVHSVRAGRCQQLLKPITKVDPI
jgi:hypothetical protein